VSKTFQTIFVFICLSLAASNTFAACESQSTTTSTPNKPITTTEITYSQSQSEPLKYSVSEHVTSQEIHSQQLPTTFTYSVPTQAVEVTTRFTETKHTTSKHLDLTASHCQH
jgi:hypothetical protein